MTSSPSVGMAVVPGTRPGDTRTSSALDGGKCNYRSNNVTPDQTQREVWPDKFLLHLALSSMTLKRKIEVQDKNACNDAAKTARR